MASPRDAALRAAVGLTFAVVTACATAQTTPAPRPQPELQQIQELLQRGAYPEAQQRAENWLQKNPGDTRARFLQGVALAAQNRIDEAIVVYRGLTDDHPELPEPHNNLATLYAARGQLDAAKVALEAALRAQPNFATAHENLGDLYARYAAESWARAADLERNRTSALTKLKAVNTLVPPAAPSAPETTR